MLIKEPASNRIFGIIPRPYNFSTKLTAYILLGMLLICIGIGLMITGAQIQKTGWFGHVLVPLLKENIGFIPKYIKGLTTKPERLVIDIQHKDYQRLAYKRDVALSKGILATSSDDFVPASIRYHDKTYKAKVRLKGDWTDGLLDKRWPLRVRIRGNNTLMGMKQFSLHHPRVRNYIHEWIYHQALQREGILNLRYDFVDVTINGKHMGIYAMEEHFYKHLIEHQGHREGPIIKFNENIMWQDRIRAIETTGWLTWTTDAAIRPLDYPDITLFQKTKTTEDPVLYKQFRTASTILEQFRAGKLSTSQVFDTDKLARFMALAELLGAMHNSVYWNNWRFYYNPVTSRLEPIGFDGNAGNETTQTSLSYLLRNPPFDHFFQDPVFTAKYLHALQRVAQPEYLETLLQNIEPELSEKLALLYRSHIYSFSTEQYLKNQAFIQRVLHPPRVLQAFVADLDHSHLNVELANIQQLPITVGGLFLSNRCVALPATPISLSSSVTNQNTQYQNSSLKWTTTPPLRPEQLSQCSLLCSIPGLTNEYFEPIHPWPHIDHAAMHQVLTRHAPNWKSFNFIKTKDLTITITAGEWDITNNLILPTGYAVHCSPGTQLRLSKTSTILSYSPLFFEGTKKHPIIVEADNSGQGIAVINATETSHLAFVSFENLTAPSQGNWQLTGAITFYESPAIFDHCTFTSNRSEDALNMIRSPFLLSGCRFYNAPSDAFDADFSDGILDHTLLSNSINDAIDISGSRVVIKNTTISQAGDKGISAGEGSHIEVCSSTIEGANIALASKDKSTLSIKNSTITNCQIGFAVYQKKSEFGPALLITDQVTLKNVPEPYLLEINSELAIVQQMIEPNCHDLVAILYGNDE